MKSRTGPLPQATLRIPLLMPLPPPEAVLQFSLCSCPGLLAHSSSSWRTGITSPMQGMQKG